VNLLNRCTVKSCTGGSNPPFSASSFVLNNLTDCDTFGDIENRRSPSSEQGSQSHQAHQNSRGSAILPRRHIS